jgi:hypothetical protein
MILLCFIDHITYYSYYTVSSSLIIIIVRQRIQQQQQQQQQHCPTVQVAGAIVGPSSSSL